jgi:hypothetical protein
MITWHGVTLVESAGSAYPSMQPHDLYAWLAARGIPFLETPGDPALLWVPYNECKMFHLEFPWRTYPAGTVGLAKIRDLDQDTLRRGQRMIMGVET